MTVLRGGEYDRWDIQVRLGPLAGARVRVAVEEHGHGRQLVRYRIWPRWSRMLPPAVAVLGLWLAGSITHQMYVAAALGGILLLLILLRAVQEAGAGVALLLRAIEREAAEEAVQPEPAEDQEPHDLLVDLRVPSVRALLHASRNGNEERSARPAEAFEAVERHG
jgi:hypothetical protein